MPVVVLLLFAAGCATSGHTYRPHRPLDPGRFTVSCDGGFDAAPALVAGKSPVFPVGMLNPEVVEDRRIRRLPMEWPVTTTFEVKTDGTTADVQSTVTAPASFGRHMTVAVRSWRFKAAMRDGLAVTSRCTTTFHYHLG